MLKVLAIFAALLLGLTVYVAIQNQRAAEHTVHEAHHNPEAITPPTGHENPQENNENPKWNPPSWYGFFAWPNSTTTWAILLTLWAVAWQANETRKAAQAALISASAAKTQIKVMRTQARHMESQTRILETSVAVAQKSADAAIAQIQFSKDKERGQLRIKFDDPDLVTQPDPIEGYVLPFTVILDGATRVNIIENLCVVAIHETGEFAEGSQWWVNMGLPKTITTEERTFKGTMTILTGKVPWGEPFIPQDESRVQLVRDEKLRMFVRVVISYQDLFGGKWQLRFNSKWKYCWDIYNNVVDSSGYWESVGDNGEYPRSNENQNPN